MIKVFIGPNGYGKTTKLNEEKKQLINSGVPEQEILFLESEILLMDQVKDTKDESKTLEFILQELFMSSPQFVNARNAFENQVSQEITANQPLMNSIVDDILIMNGSKRSPNTDFISQNPKIAYKNLVKIDSKDILNKTGSGQRMQLILKLAESSNSKKYIFIDEPEKYSHPSLLHKTAKIISDLDSKNKNVYIATHSPKLLSMLNISFSNLFVINDSTHQPKPFNFNSILSALTFSSVPCMGEKEKSFYNASKLPENIKGIYYRNFIECLFASKVYLCEGINDKLFIQEALKSDSKFYDDYCIFTTFGKFMMPVFEKIFSSLGIETQVFFDEDTKKRSTNNCHDEIDKYLEGLNHYKFVPELEDEINFRGKKIDTVAFISHLESFSFIKGKYIK